MNAPIKIDLLDRSNPVDVKNVYPAGLNSSDSYEEKFAFSKNLIKETIREKHGVFSLSFGKDSSCLAVLALEALEELLSEGVDVPEVFFISVNTLVENPIMDIYARNEIKKMREHIKHHRLPAKMLVATPSQTDNYLVNIIGARILLSTPDQGRKCTSMMKISPINKIKSKIVKYLGYNRKEAREKIVNMTGMRLDESTARAANMNSRGDTPDKPFKNFSSGNNKKQFEWMLSPISCWTVDDVYMCAAECVNGYRKSYSDLKEMIDIYRATNGGECMINVQIKGAGGKGGCGSRTGCWTCTHVSSDKSMEAMLDNAPTKYGFMKPLNHLRNLMLAYHYDLTKRNFISRSVNEDGSITIRPNTYSPEYCQNLLKWVLTIQIREEEQAYGKGIAPRFHLLSLADVLSIEFLWSRYGYTEGFAASAIYLDIYEDGKRYDMPDVPSEYNKRLPDYPKYDVPFADKFFDHFTNGNFDLDLVAGGYDSFTKKSDELSFTIDDEAADLFFQFEARYAIENYKPLNPTGVVHYLMRMGVVKIAKGKEYQLDRILCIANQLWRHSLRPILNNPDALIEKLKASSTPLPAQGQQFDIFDQERLGSISTESKNRCGISH